MANGKRRRAHRQRWRAAWVAGVATAVVLVGLGSWAVRGSGDGHPGAPVAAGAPSGTKSPAPTVTSTTNSPAVEAGEATKGLHKAKSTATPTHSAPANTGGKGTTGSDAKAPAQQTAPAGMRNITVVNRTSQTLWAVVTNSPLYPRGAHLAPGQSASVTVGNSWGGRIWGRTGCSGDASGHCLTGDCTTTCGGPTTPTTLGEFSFNAYDGMDFYDVSMVDGSNLPMYINISHTSTTDPLSASGCYQGKCTFAVDCPAAMQAKNGSQVIGCEPPCAAFGGDTYCCRGAWAGRDNCVPSKWPVDYTQVFKKAEPYAYSYAFDDGATMPCKGSCFYRVTFGVT